MTNKILTLLGFAAKAGKLSFGMQMSVDDIKKGKTKLTLIASDVSQKSQKEVMFFSHNKNISVITLKDITIDDISNAVGKKCGIISVKDNGFADAISNIIGGNADDQ